MSMRRLWLAVGAVAALMAGAVLGCFSERSAGPTAEGECSFPVGEDIPGSTIVVIRDFTFEPSEVRVRSGERVTWINCDEDSHTSTADGGQWSSPLLAPGDAFTQSFETPGELSYHCTPHAFMRARVIVE